MVPLKRNVVLAREYAFAHTKIITNYRGVARASKYLLVCECDVALERYCIATELRVDF